MRSILGKFFAACILLSACHGLPGQRPSTPHRGHPKGNNLHGPPTAKPNGIRGGDVAVRGQFSYVVSMQRYNQGVCGGSFINFQFVVTAAHCVVDQYGTFFSEQPTILASVIHLDEKKVYSSKIKVKQIYVLKAYKPEDIPDDSDDRVVADIAVMKLEEPVNTVKQNFVTKLRLPEPSTEYTGESATIVGYGWDEITTYTDPETHEVYEDGSSSGQLRFAQATVISNAVCGGVMSSIHESNICAQVVQRKDDYGEGACAGDSGGPLVHNKTLIGVLSASPIGCEENIGSGIYTRVSSYLDFIEASISDNVTEDMLTQVFKKRKDIL